MGLLLWLVVIVLIVLWAMGAFVLDLGGAVHILLIVVLVLVVFNLLRGRRVV